MAILAKANPSKWLVREVPIYKKILIIMEIKNSLEKKFIRLKIEWNLFRTSNIWMIFILKWLET